MKNIKRLFTLLIALAMIAGIAVTASAASTYSIQIEADENSGLTTNHEYSVYQIFVGELSGNVLSNIKYGSAWGTSKQGTEVSKETLDGITDAEAYAQTVLDDATFAKVKYDTLNAENTWKLTGVPTGYYLIVDDTSKALTDGDAYSKYIVQVVKDVKIAPKSEKVTSDKKEYNDAVDEAMLNEAGVGTAVSYKLTGTIAQDANSYDYYNFIMCDTLSTGLTFNNDISVKIGGTVAVKDTDYAIYLGEDGYTFQVALLNAKAHAGQNVEVLYSATLNSSAVAMVPESNTFKVVYSNDPEHKYNGEKDDNKPGKPKDITKSVFGKTPEVKPETYTTKLVLTKEDENKQKLAGATFRLTSANANQTVLKAKEYFELDNTNGTYYLLKDGTYTETAPTGTTYEKIGTGDSKTTVGYILKDGKYVVPTDTKDYIDQDLYMKVLGTDSQYESLNKYSKKNATSDASVKAPVDVILTTGTDGVLNFEGLGTGDYVLTEVDAPDGYNYCQTIKFTITFDATEKTFNISNVENATITNNEGTFATTVVDKSGSTLPSTGGVGTKMFYIIGTILVVGAAILLIAKKRTEA